MRRALEGLACFLIALAMLLGTTVYRVRQKSQAVLLQSSQKSSWAVDPKHKARTRLALKKLERNLEGELSSVKTILSRLDSSRGQTSNTMSLSEKKASKHAPQETSKGKTEEQDIMVPDAAWRKRTMQQGALRGDTVKKQLKRVLEKDLLDKIEKNTSWKSMQEIENAIKFADYLKAHPLSSPPRVKRSTLDTATAAEPTGGEGGSSGSDSVIKVHFKREEHSISEADYKQLEEDLIRLYIDLNKDKSAGAANEGVQVGSAAKAGGAGIKQLSQQFVGGAQGTQYVVQPGDRAIALSDEYGRKWAADEILREHGNFVHLPRKDELPLAVKPYWYSSLRK